MPKPRATTELCRRVRAIPRLSLMNECEKLRPKRIPRVSAIGGENNPVKERTKPRAKRIFASVGIDCEKSIRPGAERARVPQVDFGRRTPLAILPPENVEIFQRTSSLRLRWRGLAAVGVGKNMSGRLFKRLFRSGRGYRKGRLWRRRVGLGLGGRGMGEGGEGVVGGGVAAWGGEVRC